ncbi:hypothetical protein JK361_30120 [Streptomyces sp. 5-8]|uniref:Uncharacterized protein n=1 Tax=Streptomyces musisoli TaxID=2802280 RepID=A0ABS1P8T9_9ACTN|nr:MULTISPECIES: hypothetical protein [Streptomyces]MBL1108792.1 hypothetical protein [Streptomyces musisoli]MBY8842920.1 hypothetical protein [Streptomyces sp. SP2-10]
MSSSEYYASVRAQGDLRAAERARLTANTPPPLPAWWAPMAGITHGLGMALVAGPLLYEADGGARRLALLLVTLAALAAFPVMCAVRVIRMRVRSWPPRGTRKQRMLLEGLPVVAYGVAALAFLAFGQSVGAVALGVLGGGSLWWRESRKNALCAEAQAALRATGRAE